MMWLTSLARTLSAGVQYFSGLVFVPPELLRRGVASYRVHILCGLRPVLVFGVGCRVSSLMGRSLHVYFILYCGPIAPKTAKMESCTSGHGAKVGVT